jgi:hypothetical protein
MKEAISSNENIYKNRTIAGSTQAFLEKFYSYKLDPMELGEYAIAAPYYPCYPRRDDNKYVITKPNTILQDGTAYFKTIIRTTPDDVLNPKSYAVGSAFSCEPDRFWAYKPSSERIDAVYGHPRNKQYPSLAFVWFMEELQQIHIQLDPTTFRIQNKDIGDHMEGNKYMLAKLPASLLKAEEICGIEVPQINFKRKAKEILEKSELAEIISAIRNYTDDKRAAAHAPNPGSSSRNNVWSPWNTNVFRRRTV